MKKVDAVKLFIVLCLSTIVAFLVILFFAEKDDTGKSDDRKKINQDKIVEIDMDSPYKYN
jgi:hypothetical protein